MDSYDVAWAAGLFEGEGSISPRSRTGVQLQVKMCDRDVVERFARVVRFGRVYGPYRNRSGERDGYERSDFFSWTAPVADTPHILEMLWPWLSEARRTRARELGVAP